tara:strand:- start:190 stop:342 length:153 start_codon:yes stop_codon:yes gene_type:complete
MVTFNKSEEQETPAYKIFSSENKKPLTFMETCADRNAMLSYNQEDHQELG